MQIINKQEELDKICEKLSHEPVIFMDTEFYRRTTYYAILSIVQIAAGDDRIIIDARCGLNLDGLKDLLLNKDIIKVFHAAEQDFDIFFHSFGKLPVNVFDTQIAAGVVGMDNVMGYSRLCKAMLNINLDKTMQKANWLDRPLLKPLLEYAIKDVEYLIPLYSNLSSEISSRNLWDTYKSRCTRLLDPKNYQISPQRLLKKINLYEKSNKFKDQMMHFLTLREECAKANDVPRNHCASDIELIELCEKLPTNDKELSRLKARNQPIAKQKFKVRLFEICSGLREF